jgi:hypothetical protein
VSAKKPSPFFTRTCSADKGMTGGNLPPEMHGIPVYLDYDHVTSLKRVDQDIDESGVTRTRPTYGRLVMKSDKALR